MYIFFWFIVFCTFSPLWAKPSSWEIRSNETNIQEAYHPLFSVRVNIEPPISSKACWGSAYKNLLIIDIEKANRWLLWEPTPEADLKSWNIKLYALDKREWLIWKKALIAQEIKLLQIFENGQSTIFDCLLQSTPAQRDELWRIWLETNSAQMNKRLVSHGIFLKALRSPMVRKNGCARFIYLLHQNGTLESFDTLRGYLKREIHLKKALDIEIEKNKEDPVLYKLKISTDEGIFYLDPFTLHSL